jgi:putative hydrolase of HD superfamily
MVGGRRRINNEVGHLLKFLLFAGRLKSQQREGWVKKLKMANVESVADHSYRTALMAMVFGDMKGLDTEKAMKLAILHDLPEAIVGDAIPGERPKTEKEALESAAMNRLLARLPAKLKAEYSVIWRDFIACDSPEAELVRQLDKLEMAIQATEYGRDRSRPGTEEFIQSARREVKDPDLVELLESL